MNDWSARDVQAWEYQPLGPFLFKSFITTISPWVVTLEALEPFRRSQPKRPSGDPEPLAYLLGEADQAQGAFDIELEVLIQSERMRSEGLEPQRLTLSNTLSMYWTIAQMLTHHTVNGCQLQAGDLMGSRTLSGAEHGQFGSLLEITEGGKKPVVLSSGEERRFLEDGDEIFLKARCTRPGMASIGFGECRGKARVRLVARDSVNLRYLPSMRAEVIMPLKQYAVLEVVDSSDKTWLEVIYKHEGIEIQGWVSRSMVKTIQ